MPDEFRIEYTIQRNQGDENWTDVGFGSSGAWLSIDEAEYSMHSYIQNRQWEREGNMPKQNELETAGE